MYRVGFRQYSRLYVDMRSRKKVFHCSIWEIIDKILQDSYTLAYNILYGNLIASYFLIPGLDRYNFAHNLHFSLVFLLYAERRQLYSFVTEFKEASTNYSRQCIKQFTHGPHTLRVPQYFHISTQAAFFRFNLGPLLFVASLFYPQ